MSSPSSRPATPSPLPRPTRTAYGLTDKRGWFLLELARDFDEYTPDPVAALRHNMLWLSQEVAVRRLRDLAASRKGLELTVARVELEMAEDGCWRAISTGGPL